MTTMARFVLFNMKGVRVYITKLIAKPLL